MLSKSQFIKNVSEFSPDMDPRVRELVEIVALRTILHCSKVHTTVLQQVAGEVTLHLVAGYDTESILTRIRDEHEVERS